MYIRNGSCAGLVFTQLSELSTGNICFMGQINVSHLRNQSIISVIIISLAYS